MVVLHLVCLPSSVVFHYSQKIKTSQLKRGLDKNYNKDEDYFCYQLFQCFAAEPENISPWDFFIDRHFSFGLCCISPAVCAFSVADSLSFSPCGSNFICRPLAGKQVKPHRTPLSHLCSKPQSAVIQCVSIYNMCMHLWTSMWVYYCLCTGTVSDWKESLSLYNADDLIPAVY